MRDLWVVSTMLVSFAAFVTVHVLIVGGLAWRTPRVRAVVALFVLPLAPYWAFRERMRFRCVAWVVFAAVYGAARLLARS